MTAFYWWGTSPTGGRYAVFYSDGDGEWHKLVAEFMDRSRAQDYCALNNQRHPEPEAPAPQLLVPARSRRAPVSGQEKMERLLAAMRTLCAADGILTMSVDALAQATQLSHHHVRSTMAALVDDGRVQIVRPGQKPTAGVPAKPAIYQILEHGKGGGDD